jgi:hypothetical protein
MRYFVWSNGQPAERTECIGVQKRRVQYVSIEGYRDGYEYYTQSGEYISFIPVSSDVIPPSNLKEELNGFSDYKYEVHQVEERSFITNEFKEDSMKSDIYLRLPQEPLITDISAPEYKVTNKREENMSRMTTRELMPQQTVSPYYSLKTNEERIILEEEFMRPKDTS